MTNKQIKRCSTLVIIREMQVKIAITPHTYQDDYYLKKKKERKKRSVGKNMEKSKPLCTTGRKIKCYNLWKKNFLKKLKVELLYDKRSCMDVRVGL